jgi:hypothetical protein
MTYALNHAGLREGRNGIGAHWCSAAPRVDPATVKWVKPRVLHEAYLIRVGDVKKYLTAAYGDCTLVWDGYTKDWRTPFTGVTQGIIVFEWRGAPRVSELPVTQISFDWC